MGTTIASVSIILPFRNSERWLPETLQSLDADLQGFAGNADLVFVDSMSGDGSRELVEQFVRAQARPAQLVSASKPGAAAARNAGALHARGEWLSFIDADDVAVRGRLSALMQCAESAGTSVALLYSSFTDFHQKGGRWVEGRIRVPELSERDPALSLLAPENFLQIGSTLIRRSAWLEVSGMDESMPIVHDVNLYVRLAIAGHALRRCKTVTPSLLFRQHPAGSLTTSSPSNFYADAERNADLVRSHYTEIGRVHEEHVQAGLRDAYFFLAYGYARADPKALVRVCETLDRFTCFPVPERAGRSLKFAARVAGYRRALAWSAKWTRLKSRATSLREPG